MKFESLSLLHKMKIVVATILLLAATTVLVAQAARDKETFLKQQNVTKSHIPEYGKAEGCDYVKCGEAIVGCAEKCGKDLASLDCIECLGPLYESCKSCF